MADGLGPLIEAAQRGDPDAFEALYDRFERSIYGFCWQLLDDPVAAEEACQQTFVEAWANLPRLRHPEAFSVWLRHGALTACRQQRRRRQRERPASEALGPDSVEAMAGADPGDRPGDALARQETIAAVREALGRLSEPHREVIVMHHLQGWPLETIARTLHVAEGTVKSRLGRARARLAQLLRGPLEMSDE